MILDMRIPRLAVLARLCRQCAMASPLYQPFLVEDNYVAEACPNQAVFRPGGVAVEGGRRIDCQ